MDSLGTVKVFGLHIVNGNGDFVFVAKLTDNGNDVEAVKNTVVN